MSSGGGERSSSYELKRQSAAAGGVSRRAGGGGVSRDTGGAGVSWGARGVDDDYFLCDGAATADDDDEMENGDGGHFPPRGQTTGGGLRGERRRPSTLSLPLRRPSPATPRCAPLLGGSEGAGSSRSDHRRAVAEEEGERDGGCSGSAVGINRASSHVSSSSCGVCSAIIPAW